MEIMVIIVSTRYITCLFCLGQANKGTTGSKSMWSLWAAGCHSTLTKETSVICCWHHMIWDTVFTIPWDPSCGSSEQPMLITRRIKAFVYPLIVLLPISILKTKNCLLHQQILLTQSRCSKDYRVLKGGALAVGKGLFMPTVWFLSLDGSWVHKTDSSSSYDFTVWPWTFSLGLWNVFWAGARNLFELWE